MNLKAIISADISQLETAFDRARNDAKKTAKGLDAAFRRSPDIHLNTKLAQRQLKDLERLAQGSAGGIRRAFSGISTSIGTGASSISSAFAGLGTELLTSTIGKLTQGFSLAVKTGIDFRKMMEGAGVVFENFAGSAAGAQKHLDDLSAFSKSSPFDLPDLIQASARMQAFGTNINQVVPDLKHLQNAAALAAGTSGNFTEALAGITTALGQMRAKGKVSAEEMQQLVERGIPAWELLAQKIGKSVDETQKLSELGQLRGAPAADALLEAFGEGKFAGLGEKLARTTLGKESNLRDALTQQAGAAAKDTIDAYNAALDAALRASQSENARKLGGRMDKLVAGNLGAMAEVSDALSLTGNQQGKTSILEAFKEMGRDTYLGFVTGFAKDNAGIVKTVKTWIADTKTALGSHSASTVYIEIGEDATEGFVVGFENGKEKILAANEKLVAELKRQWHRANKDFAGMFEEASQATNLPLEILMAVGSRETNMRNIVGDRGRGAGVMQVDIGTDAAFKASGAWKDAGAAIQRGAEILREKMDSLIRMAGKEMTIKDRAGKAYKFTVPKLEGEQLQQTALAMYNSGWWAPYHVSKGRSPDYGTTGRDYSADVLSRAEVFKSFIDGGGTALKNFAEAITQATAPLQKLAATIGQALPTMQPRQIDLPLVRGGDGAAAAPLRGSMIWGGEATMGVSALREGLVPLQQISLAMNELSRDTKLAKAAMTPLPPAMATVAEATTNWAERIIQSGDKIGQATDRLANFKDRLGQSFDSIIEAFLQGGEGWKRAALSTVNEIFSTLASEMMLAATGGKYSSLGQMIGGALGSMLSGLFGFGGARAGGGPVAVGKTYLVGEQGPELFQPRVSGRILDHETTTRTLGQAGGSSNNITINFAISSATGTVSRETQSQIAARTAEALNHAVARNR